jgi:rhodanese-related sulfurtransferase
MAGLLSPTELRRRWRDGDEVALLDVREEAFYAKAHPLFANSVALGKLELQIFDLVPRFDAPVVVYDDGEGLAAQAVFRLEALGYSQVFRLEGGLAGYGQVGELYQDVNAASKAFGELVESIRHTPSLPAPELQKLIDAKADMVILDSRRFEEYHTMSIPGGTSVPGAELTLRAWDLAPSPDTLVVVNCAGRTRSIIGAQTLVNAGLPNKVAALRNGTIGWTLAGQSLEHGQTRRYDSPSPAGLAKARAAAEAWATQVGVKVIDTATLAQWRQDKARTLYQLDVRSPEEYRQGHAAGFRSAPGGQLVQATDEWIAVRGARIVLLDDEGVRARMTAAWLVQMGWNAVVLETGSLPLQETGDTPVLRPSLPPVDYSDGLPEGALVLDLAPSPIYRKGHIPGARFVLPSRFAEDLPKLEGAGPLVLTSPDGATAAFAAAEAARISGRPVTVLAGGTAAFAADHALSRDEDWLSPPVDVYKRPYEGTDNAAEAMQAYLDWEYGLVAQLANDGVSNFRVVRAE